MRIGVLADRGIGDALAASPALRSGVDIADGQIVHQTVAQAVASAPMQAPATCLARS
jgi:alanine dehydrogenase